MSDDNERGPGWLRMAGALVRAPFEERMLREETARHERLRYEAASVMLEQTVRLVQPEDDEFTQQIGGTANDRSLDASTSQELRERAIQARYRSPLMAGYLRTLKRFVMGRGPSFEPEVENDDLRAAMDSWWRLFGRLNRWDRLEDEIAGRTWRDGETFIRRFVTEKDGPVPFDLGNDVTQRLSKLGVAQSELRPPEAPKGMTMLRVLNPEHIRDPDNIVTDGIVTSSEDVQTVLGYIYAPGKDSGGTVKAKFIHADEVWHTPIEVDSDVKRGRSILEPLLKRDRQYEDWLNYRLALSLARSAVTLLKKVENATPSQVAAIRNSQATQREDPSSDRKTRMMRPGTTVTVGPGISYEYLAPNIQGADARYDGRNILLNMAAATGLPEFMFTADSSNANFASALVSEGPAYREFQSWQDFFTPLYESIYRSVMVAGAAAGSLKADAEEMAEMKISTVWPTIEVRDDKQHAEANAIRKASGVLSGRTWTEEDGRDWEVERDRLRVELEDAIEFTAPAEE